MDNAAWRLYFDGQDAPPEEECPAVSSSGSQTSAVSHHRRPPSSSSGDVAATAASSSLPTPSLSSAATDPAAGTPLGDGRRWFVQQLHRFFVSSAPEGGARLVPPPKLDADTASRQCFSVVIDVQEFVQHTPIHGFFQHLIESPTVVLACTGLALYLAYKTRLGPSEWFDTFPKVHPRFINLPQQVSMRSLRTSLVGRMVSLRGTVVRCSTIRSAIVSVSFVCPKCGARQASRWPDSKAFAPKRCITKGCRAKTLTPDRSSAVSEDCQKIRLQEIIENDHQEDAGRMPRTIECELRNDLVDSCAPGDEVVVVGTVKTIVAQGSRLAGPTAGNESGGNPKGVHGQHRNSNNNNNNNNNNNTGGGGGAQGSKIIYLLYLEASSIVGARRGVGPPTAASVPPAIRNTAAAESAPHPSKEEEDGLLLTAQDRQAIEAIRQEPDLFRLLVHSLCPGIFGNDLVKAGLILTLFGGCCQVPDDDAHRTLGRRNRSGLPVRGDSHCLIVGDPGLGKSQMLKAVSQVAPRSVYVCGNTTTSTGLTVTVVKDPSTGDFSLEAGALVLADQGVCCIDEFDKMASLEHQSLLEAMEQQSISVAKAGIVCTLPARASIVAAANPVGGHYNRGKTVADNIKLPAPLLSRFDLIFILLDRADATRDRLLSEHIMAIHGSPQQRVDAGHEREKGKRSAAPAIAAANRLLDESVLLSERGVRLAGRLALRPRERLDVIPLPLLRKYVSYARRAVHPLLSSASASILQEFYLSLRQSHTGEGTPITTRQLEALVRLSEARARCELRTLVTAQDARDVLDIVKDSLFHTVVDPEGNVDFDRPFRPAGQGKAKDVTRFVSALDRQARARESPVFHMNELWEVAAQLGILTELSGSFDEFIAKLNENGYLLKRGPGLYKLSIQT